MPAAEPGLLPALFGAVGSIMATFGRCGHDLPIANLKIYINTFRQCKWNCPPIRAGQLILRLVYGGEYHCYSERAITADGGIERLWVHVHAAHRGRLCSG